MAKNYIDNKRGKKKSALRVAWILILLAAVFAYVVIKFAVTGNMSVISGGLPSGDDAYTVAKDFVKSTVRSSNVDFPNNGYQLGKRGDSTYIIKSVAEITGDNGDRRRTNFRVLMEYKGGKQNESKNWSLLNISEEQ